MVNTTFRQCLRSRLVLGCVGVLQVLMSTHALACTKDTDCKGTRICEKSRCVAASLLRGPAKTSRAAGRPVSPSEGTQPQPSAEHRDGWLILAGVRGVSRPDETGGRGILGGGFTIGYRWGNWTLVAEVLAPVGAYNNLSGGGVGAFVAVPITSGVELNFGGLIGAFFTTLNDGMVTWCGGVCLPMERQYFVRENLVIISLLRLGSSLVFEVGPRVAIGTQDVMGDLLVPGGRPFIEDQIFLSLGAQIQVGYQF